jgi:hypothetical protein
VIRLTARNVNISPIATSNIVLLNTVPPAFCYGNEQIRYLLIPPD